MSAATASSIITQNAAFQARKIPGGAALFVGGTSGIGLATMKAYTKMTDSPRIYFAGRNAAAASTITSDLQVLNPTAKITFLPVSDLALISESDALAKTYQSLEPGPLQLLVLSCGLMNSPSPFTRHRTAEGIDPALALNVFSRLHIVRALLPQLTAASEEPGRTVKPAVVSIFAPGHGGNKLKLDLEDLTLDKPGAYSAGNAASVGSAVKSIALDWVVKESGGKIRALHVFPGIVSTTGYVREWPKLAIWGLKLLSAPIAVEADDVGQGIGWLATRAEGEDGRVGLLDWRGRPKGERYWGSEEPGRVWEKLGEVTERILKGEFRTEKK